MKDVVINVRRLSLSLLVLFQAGLPSLAAAQESSCDPGLRPPENNPFGYEIRGDRERGDDRCEGVYIQEVSNTALQVASFTQLFEDYDPEADSYLNIEWGSFGTSPTRIRAVGLKSRLYYQMDAIRPGGSTSFQWPVGILLAQNISRKDIGVLGWVHHTFDGVERVVYVPLRLTRQKGTAQSSTYTLLLVPGRELDEVYISLAPVDAAGHTQDFIRDGPLNYSYYPADQPIDIPISDLPAPGIYYVEIGAVFKSGGSSNIEFFFHHAQ